MTTPITQAAREACERLRTTAGFGYWDKGGWADRVVTEAFQDAIDQARAADQKVIDEYHRVMNLLRNTKMEHGQCQPRSRKACTRCNAQDELDRLVADYKGAPIRAQ